jgi:hypothetical protein
VSIVGALLITGSGLPITNVMRAYDARTAAAKPGYPAQAQGLDFLGAPAIADVTGDGRAEILQGGDSSALHGFGAGGRQAGGFPKFHTGWVLYAPSTGDLDSDGRTDVVTLTREGYLMAWRTRGIAAGNREWWSFRHDERNTSNYGADTRPPGAVQGARLARGRVRFRAPGDDWYGGRRVARYRLTVRLRGGRTRHLTRRARLGAGRTTTLRLPAGTRAVTVRPQDRAGNLGTPVTARA